MNTSTERQAAIEYFYSVARHTYRAYPLAYHNWGHVLGMLSWLDTLFLDVDTTEPGWIELTLAILYHDIVYVPGSYAGYNEETSALMFKRDFNNWIREGSIDIDVDLVCDLIRATSVANHVDPAYVPKSIAEAILLDLDLVSLAAPYTTFLTNQKAIIAEQVGRNSFEEQNARVNSAQFLAKFIAPERKSIYHTTDAQFAFEEKARRNINQYLYGEEN